jgi:peptidoglycan/LPS O-acetylase OafA/YrhL
VRLLPKSLLVRAADNHRGNNFDAIRLAMALLVVWSHSFAIHLGNERTEPVFMLLNGGYKAGQIGVLAFFVISGFLISQSWDRSKTARAFFEKRVRRIYPGYMAATAICAFVISPLFGGSFPNVARTLGANLLLRNELPVAFPSNPYPGPVNGSLWSIPFEFWCYVGVAAAGTMLFRRPRALCALCLVFMLANIGQIIAGTTSGLGPIGLIFGAPWFWSMLAPSFLLGMIAYSLRDRLPRSRALLVVLIVMAIAGCWLGRPIGNMLVAPALAYAVLYAAFSGRLKLHNAARFGDFSYGTYLYAFPIQQMLQSTTNLSLPTFIVASLALSLLAGVVSWHLVERRFLFETKRMSTARPATGAPPEAAPVIPIST